jgi:hypothetical protein
MARRSSRRWRSGIGGHEFSKVFPDTVYPINSRIGNWQLQVWNGRRLAVDFLEPILITEGALGGGILLLGRGIESRVRRRVA